MVPLRICVSVAASQSKKHLDADCQRAGDRLAARRPACMPASHQTKTISNRSGSKDQLATRCRKPQYEQMPEENNFRNGWRQLANQMAQPNHACREFTNVGRSRIQDRPLTKSTDNQQRSTRQESGCFFRRLTSTILDVTVSVLRYRHRASLRASTFESRILIDHWLGHTSGSQA